MGLRLLVLLRAKMIWWKWSITVYFRCASDWFQCADGHCIHGSWRCDGHHDCMGGDNSDEDDCPEASELPETTCNPNEFRWDWLKNSVVWKICCISRFIWLQWTPSVVFDQLYSVLLNWLIDFPWVAICHGGNGFSNITENVLMWLESCFKFSNYKP